MHTLCSSTSAIPPISENRRRLMQYTHKDTCNNQTLPHPTTPLGTLTHKTPPQHTLAGNLWTTSDLRVMSIVLGLLDTPLYLETALHVSGGTSTHHQERIQLYLQHPLSWKSWNSSNSSKIVAGSSNSVTNTRCRRYSCMHSWWWVEVPPETCRAVCSYK